jgi:UDP-glucuronate 4-epimerase
LNKHYIITGGAGFIGSNLIRTLLNNDPGVKVTCIDNFDPFYAAELKHFNIRDFKTNPNFRLLFMDLAKSSAEDLRDSIREEADVIIHLAAKAGVWPSVHYPAAYQEANVLGLQNILEFARSKNIRQFVFGSSSSVYGINNHYPWKEDEELLPISPYAMTKLAGEMLGHVYSKLFGIRFIALRFFTVYGPSQRPDLAIHKFTKAILNEKPITMYGDGSTSRDYTYVDDIVKGIIAAVNYEKSGFEIINLGNNYPVKLIDLVALLEEITGRKAKIEKLPEQPGDVPKTFADISKARKLLHYQPSTPLREGLKKFYEWFEENRELLMNT